MRFIVFVCALLAVLFWSASAFDMWATLTQWNRHHEMLGWAGAPAWRNAAWGASIAVGFAGAAALFWRARWAGDFMLTAVGFMTAGLAWDLVFGEGFRAYGQSGLASSAAIIAVAAMFTWAAYQFTKPPTVVQLA
ncbi:MAG: hypothetical protein JNJ73_07395 [Hyphomonadaceae bacterium]|nr:hypothetical protein [Hyphomonadaceae bacterium]